MKGGIVWSLLTHRANWVVPKAREQGRYQKGTGNSIPLTAQVEWPRHQGLSVEALPSLMACESQPLAGRLSVSIVHLAVGQLGQSLNGRLNSLLLC